MVTYTVKGLVLGVSHAPPQGGRIPALPILGSQYLCLHPLTHNDQIRHANQYGEGRVFTSATPLCLHKCVVQFVSDSRVSCITYIIKWTAEG